MKRILPLLALFLLAPRGAWCDPTEPFGFVKPVVEQDGDTIATAQPTCACTAGCIGPAALLSAAVTNKTLRKRTFVNTNAFEVFIGTQTSVASLNNTGFRLDASTGTYHTFSTYSTSAFYCQNVGASSGTVTTLSETNSIP